MKAILMSNRLHANYSMSKEAMEKVAGVIVGFPVWHKGKKYKITKAQLMENQGLVELIITIE